MIEYIIIIILVVILFLSIKKTNLNHFQTVGEAKDCKYVPWGPNFDFCTDNCQSQNKVVPKKLNISGISYGTKVTLTWNNYNDADKYIIHYYDLTKYSNKINVIQVNKTDQDTMTHDITILDSNKNYTFLIYGINRYGISDVSNNINLKT
jgi:hypothetical protein